MESIKFITEGLLNNFVIVILSSILPFGVGIVISLLASKKQVVGKIFNWISLPFECFCLPALLYVNYFFIFSPKQVLLPIIVTTYTVCFIGYMPARYISTFSFQKNILYNGLGLLSSLFKWSFIASMVGYTEVFQASSRLVNHSYNTSYYIIPFILSFIVIIIFETAKRFVKQFMK